MFSNTARTKALPALEKIVDELGRMALVEVRKTLNEDEPIQPADTLIAGLEIKKTGNPFQVEIGTRDVIGHELEFGSSNALPRPWLLPAIHSAIPALRQTVSKAFFRAMKMHFTDQISRKENT